MILLIKLEKGASGMLCHKPILLKLKENFYMITIRSAMLYGVKC